MKLRLLLACFAIGCSSPPQQPAVSKFSSAPKSPEPSQPESQSKPTSQPMADSKQDCAGDPYSDEFMKRAIETLAQPAWEGRKFESPGLIAAVDWTKKQFACVGLTPGAAALGINGIEQPFETTGDEVKEGHIPILGFDKDKKYKFTNLIGSIPGTGSLANEVIVIGAHIDHLGMYNGGMVLGADDDASGILALLSLSKSILSEAAPADRRTLVFVSFGVEEEPFALRGSKAFLEALSPASKEKIVHYINFDMIGHYSDKNKIDALGAFPETTAEKLIEPIAKESGLNFEIGDHSTASDQATFCEAGIPYLYLWSENKSYHTAEDTTENIDYENMSTILKIATEVTKKLAVEPDLKSNKASFTQNFKEKHPDRTCLGNSPAELAAAEEE